MRLRLASALAATLSLAPVMAHATASQAAGFSWTGMFIGINAGYARGHSDWDFSGNAGSTNHTIEGGTVGIQAGYNAQLQSNIVAGIEGTIQGGDVDGASSCGAGTSRCKTNVASLSDISGRLGVNSGTSLLFGKLGVAYQNLQNKITSTPGEDKGGSLGWIAGAGVEFYIDNNITTNIEYNYYHFNDNSASVGGSHFNDSDSLSLVKAGLNLKFN